MYNIFQRKAKQREPLFHLVERAVDLLFICAADIAGTVVQKAVISGFDDAGMCPLLVDVFPDDPTHCNSSAILLFCPKISWSILPCAKPE